jgi:hypothetical protein
LALSAGLVYGIFCFVFFHGVGGDATMYYTGDVDAYVSHFAAQPKKVNPAMTEARRSPPREILVSMT